MALFSDSVEPFIDEAHWWKWVSRGRPLRVTPTPGPRHAFSTSLSVSVMHTLPLPQVLFLPTGLGKAEETFTIVCDNCQIKEFVVVGGGVAPGAALHSGIGILCLPHVGGWESEGAAALNS